MTKQPTVTSKMIMNLVEQQDFRCAISGRELTPQTASLDHILPLSRGGEHGINNVWVVDHQVNSAKGTMTCDEFVTMCRDVATHQEKQLVDAAA
ncbi:MAG: HNH endonuclease [Planctomycetes bacterium]|nr:HNH endonuclease [Planctomycetota bacterium]